MNSDSVSTFNKNREIVSFLDVPTESDSKHFANLPKHILDMLERGDIEEALALINKEKGEEIQSNILERLFSMITLKAFRKQAKKVAKPTVSFKKTQNWRFHHLIKNIAMKIFHSMLQIPVTLLKSFAFLVNAGQKISTATIKFLSLLKLQLTHASHVFYEFIDKTIIQRLTKLASPYVAQYQKLVDKFAEIWQFSKKRMDIWTQKIKEQMVLAQQKMIDFFQPVTKKIHESLEYVRFLKESTKNRIEHVMNTIIRNVMEVIQPVVHWWAGFVVQRREALQYSQKEMGHHLKQAKNWFQQKGSAAYLLVSHVLIAPLQSVYQQSKWLLKKIFKMIARFGKKIWCFFMIFFRVSSCIGVQVMKALWFVMKLFFHSIWKKCFSKSLST